ncbi:MAG: hypothetical protein D6784_07750 [Chloroflexi bacterium]|nr:MAG: hypothetical protein D6784_07750 [Chloroflexota bacterium]
MEAPQTAPPSPAAAPAPRPVTQMTLGCVVIPLLVVVMAVAAYSLVRANATSRLTIPPGVVAQVRSAPSPDAPLLARFGEGTELRITGRTADWRWLEVSLWDNRRGWILRPLDILVWQLEAPETTPQPMDPPPVIEARAMEYVDIPATTFTMGSPPGLGEADESPPHPVSVSAFRIGRFEVTVGQYWACVEAGECTPPISSEAAGEAHYINDPAFTNHPVVNITWTQANRYCLWQGGRLPTEAEWELAASWDSTRNAKLRWPWGNQADAGAANVGPTSQGRPVEGGSFPQDRSPAGVMDMGGNVSEWVFDWYKVDYYRVADSTDPLGPSYRRGEGTGRVVRGGSYADPLEAARTTNRHHQEAGYGTATIGFRCALGVK